MEFELRQNISNLVKKYEKVKEELTYEEQKYIEGRINVAKTLLKKPKSPTYSDGHGDIQIGKLMHRNCLYCHEPLDKFRQPNSFRIDPTEATNKEKYCSKSCMVQHSKMVNKMKKCGANNIFWGKDWVKLCYTFKCDNSKRKIPHVFEIYLPTRKTRANNFKDNTIRINSN